ncbi:MULTISPECIES: gamma-glutamyl-gamma-aminobutyrate hydrolase family protein [Vagococcus]|uniref:gamma-glutamyl-gamma-aminobutyrate hydrolase family protein n=1 Tax=Vagococcus TaxID=2737 RepID=UPI000E48D73F|nr:MULTISPECIES: gamma-glutamyl-gamma-aminobutyrate hydrolase family protein [Vagococcus]RHH68177.1 gamma-glutamyl-gamma-aminobutyrate hydrolase family protein [Vagococcus sp. AM17-17]
MKKMIGISANEIIDSGETLHNLPISYLPAGYVRAVQEVGGVPVVIPLGKKEDAKEYVSLIDKLILTGGQNVTPTLYLEGKEPINEHLSLLERDVFEMALIKEAIKQQKPIFGVCRGMQLVNVYLGGTLHQDLSLRNPEPIRHMQAPIERWVATHDIYLESDSLLRPIYGANATVNSFHFQSINKIGNDLKITAVSEDGVVESIESSSDNHKILGVQWHPDFAYDTLEKEKEVFDFVVNSF